MPLAGPVIVGVDGCPAGWIAVFHPADSEPLAEVFSTFAELAGAFPTAIIAVDMPIGLPDFSVKGGRGPEVLVRPLLRQRQSSVFSIPSRAAIYAETAAFITVEAWHEAHRRTSDVARKTSDPPRGVSIQAFGIFAKIREIDALMRERIDIRGRVFESHPEVAFRQINGRQAMRLPKKVKGVVNPAGMEERKALLCAHGYDRGFLDRPPPAGAKTDDFLDAACMMLVAGRISRGEARPFPDPSGHDAFGIPVAIWA
jgi:predicted RNase H-like nuclease